MWTGLGIVAAYLAAALGLSFYFRRRIGTRLWRKAHRATIVVYALSVVHTLGAGTDAASPWLRGWLVLTGPVIAGLFLVRLTTPWRQRRRASSGGRRSAAAPARAPTRARGESGVIGDGVVIVGGGLAGQRCAETLRRRGYDGTVTMVCDEPELPYDRPPLSKAGFDGDVHFRPSPAWYADNEVELRLGERATLLDASKRRLALDTGGTLRYDQLLIATGAAPRALPALEGFTNAHPLRTLDDARRLRSVLAPGLRLAIIGAGFIGQEVAATAVAAGAQVTMLEAMPLPLAGLLGERIGRWLAELHAAAGVRVLLSAKLTGARGNGRVEELFLAGGRTVGCDAVVVGVGVAPAAGWLEGTGLDPTGVLTDPGGRTAIPHVYAAGDVCRAFDPRRGVYAAHGALGRRFAPGSHGGIGDARGADAGAGPPELLERPVRPADPVRG